jgi:hypothetical protein
VDQHPDVSANALPEWDAHCNGTTGATNTEAARRLSVQEPPSCREHAECRKPDAHVYQVHQVTRNGRNCDRNDGSNAKVQDKFVDRAARAVESDPLDIVEHAERPRSRRKKRNVAEAGRRLHDVVRTADAENLLAFWDAQRFKHELGPLSVPQPRHAPRKPRWIVLHAASLVHCRSRVRKCSFGLASGDSDVEVRASDAGAGVQGVGLRSIFGVDLDVRPIAQNATHTARVESPRAT